MPWQWMVGLHFLSLLAEERQKKGDDRRENFTFDNTLWWPLDRLAGAK
jgi:hypothetical protein